MHITLEQLNTLITSQFDGTLAPGRHEPDGAGCILEAASVAAGLPWDDDPTPLRVYDLRDINDMPVSKALRAQWMPRLFIAYQGCLDWPTDRQQSTVTRIVLWTVQELIAELPGLPTPVRQQCRSAQTLVAAAEATQDEPVAARAARGAAEAAQDVAWGSRLAAARVAQLAAHEAALAAAEAAAEDDTEAAARAAAENIFVTTCRGWLDAAGESR